MHFLERCQVEPAPWLGRFRPLAVCCEHGSWESQQVDGYCRRTPAQWTHPSTSHASHATGETRRFGLTATSACNGAPRACGPAAARQHPFPVECGWRLGAVPKQVIQRLGGQARRHATAPHWRVAVVAHNPPAHLATPSAATKPLLPTNSIPHAVYLQRSANGPDG